MYKFWIWRAKEAGNKVKEVLTKKHSGIDGFVVTIGLCIIALLICVIMKDQLAGFITAVVGQLQSKALEVLGS